MKFSSKLVILWVILGVCVVNASVAIFTGKQPPEALYGVLGTIGTYVLWRDHNDDEDDEEEKPKKKRKVKATPAAEDDDLSEEGEE